MELSVEGCIRRSAPSPRPRLPPLLEEHRQDFRHMRIRVFYAHQKSDRVQQTSLSDQNLARTCMAGVSIHRVHTLVGKEKYSSNMSSRGKASECLGKRRTASHSRTRVTRLDAHTSDTAKKKMHGSTDQAATSPRGSGESLLYARPNAKQTQALDEGDAKENDSRKKRQIAVQQPCSAIEEGRLHFVFYYAPTPPRKYVRVREELLR